MKERQIPERFDRGGGPAFPGQDECEWFYGMTLRDWFAGQALAGEMTRDDGGHRLDVARRCYAFADAMLRERDCGGDHKDEAPCSP